MFATQGSLNLIHLIRMRGARVTTERATVVAIFIITFILKVFLRIIENVIQLASGALNEKLNRKIIKDAQNYA